MYSDVVKALKDAGFKVVGERVDEPIPGTLKLKEEGMKYTADTFGRKKIYWTFSVRTRAHSVTELEDISKNVAEALYEKFDTVWDFTADFNNLEANIVFVMEEYVE